MIRHRGSPWDWEKIWDNIAHFEFVLWIIKIIGFLIVLLLFFTDFGGIVLNYLIDI